MFAYVLFILGMFGVVAFAFIVEDSHRISDKFGLIFGYTGAFISVVFVAIGVAQLLT